MKRCIIIISVMQWFRMAIWILTLILHFFLNLKQKPWIVPCSFIWSIYFLIDRAYTPTFYSLFFSSQKFSLHILEVIHALICVFIQHKDPIWSSNAEPPVGSRKRNEKAYAQSAKKYHQDRTRSGPFPFFLLFIISSQQAIVQCDFPASHKRMDS